DAGGAPGLNGGQPDGISDTQPLGVLLIQRLQVLVAVVHPLPKLRKSVDIYEICGPRQRDPDPAVPLHHAVGVCVLGGQKGDRLGVAVSILQGTEELLLRILTSDVYICKTAKLSLSF